MCTGDNLLTAVSVARECCIVDTDRPLYVVELDEANPNLLRLATMEHDTSHSSKSTTGSNGHTAVKVRLDQMSSSEEMIEDDGVTFDASALSDLLSSKMAAYQLGIAGPTFAHLLAHLPELADAFCFAGCVYARMSPDQKAALVDRCQQLGYTVAMCGDGANDCGALKAAHAGISLSEAEASIASPFTSQVADIRCVATVIREGEWRELNQ